MINSEKSEVKMYANALSIAPEDLAAYNHLPLLVRQMVLRHMVGTGLPMSEAIETVEKIAAKMLNAAFASKE